MEMNEVQAAAAAQFNRQSDRYGRSHILADTSDVRAALSHVVLPPNPTALDIATGGGHTALALARAGCSVTLTDIAGSMVKNAAALLQAEGFACRTQICAAEALPFADASFDLASCRVAPHHFSNPAGFIDEVARVLRPGGYFVLIDGSVSHEQPESEAWLHRVEKLRDPSHHRLLNDREWSELVSAAGLQTLHQELAPLEQPDLEWYFETANTPPENRLAVLREVETAPAEVRHYLRLAEVEGRIVWYWPRLTLVAQKNLAPQG